MIIINEVVNYVTFRCQWYAVRSSSHVCGIGRSWTCRLIQEADQRGADWERAALSSEGGEGRVYTGTGGGAGQYRVQGWGSGMTGERRQERVPQGWDVGLYSYMV